MFFISFTIDPYLANLILPFLIILIIFTYYDKMLLHSQLYSIILLTLLLLAVYRSKYPTYYFVLKYFHFMKICFLQCYVIVSNKQLQMNIA
jgi:predicted membrane protein